MKKTKVAVSVIVALGVIWTGAAWLTGKTIESHMDELVQNANAELTNSVPAAGLKISHKDYRRGVFSSTTQMIIEPTSGNSLLKSGQSIIINEKIDHGPLPFSRLKHFRLLPVMAATHSELVNNATLNPLFQITKNVTPLTADTDISYSGAITSDINILPVDFTNEQNGMHVAWSASTTKIDSDTKWDKIKLTSAMNNIAITLPDETNAAGAMVFNLSGLNMDINSHLAAFDVRVGEQNVGLKNITISQNNQSNMKLDGLLIHTQFDADDKLLHGNMRYALDNLMLKDQPLGQGQLNIVVSNVSLAALKQFSDNYKAQTNALLRNPEHIDGDEYRQILLKNLPLLLKDNPELAIAPLSWKNDKGESQFKLSLNFNDPALSSDNPTNVNQIADRTLKALDSKLVINIDMAKEMIKHLLIVEGHSESAAESLAAQQVSILSESGRSLKLTTEQNNAIESSLQYTAGQVTLNGQVMPLEQFLMQTLAQGLSPMLGY